MNRHCTYLPAINSCDNESIGLSSQENKENKERHIVTRIVIKT